MMFIRLLLIMILLSLNTIMSNADTSDEVTTECFDCTESEQLEKDNFSEEPSTERNENIEQHIDSHNFATEANETPETTESVTEIELTHEADDDDTLTDDSDAYNLEVQQNTPTTEANHRHGGFTLSNKEVEIISKANEIRIIPKKSSKKFKLLSLILAKRNVSSRHARNSFSRSLDTYEQSKFADRNSKNRRNRNLLPLNDLQSVETMATNQNKQLGSSQYPDWRQTKMRNWLKKKYLPSYSRSRGVKKDKPSFEKKKKLNEFGAVESVNEKTEHQAPYDKGAAAIVVRTTTSGRAANYEKKIDTFRRKMKKYQSGHSKMQGFRKSKISPKKYKKIKKVSTPASFAVNTEISGRKSYNESAEKKDTKYTTIGYAVVHEKKVIEKFRRKMKKYHPSSFKKSGVKKGKQSFNKLIKLNESSTEKAFLTDTGMGVIKFYNKSVDALQVTTTSHSTVTQTHSAIAQLYARKQQLLKKKINKMHKKKLKHKKLHQTQSGHKYKKIRFPADIKTFKEYKEYLRKKLKKEKLKRKPKPKLSTENFRKISQRPSRRTLKEFNENDASLGVSNTRNNMIINIKIPDVLLMNLGRQARLKYSLENKQQIKINASRRWPTSYKFENDDDENNQYTNSFINTENGGRRNVKYVDGNFEFAKNRRNRTPGNYKRFFTGPERFYLKRNADLRKNMSRNITGDDSRWGNLLKKNFSRHVYDKRKNNTKLNLSLSIESPRRELLENNVAEINLYDLLKSGSAVNTTHRNDHNNKTKIRPMYFHKTAIKQGNSSTVTLPTKLSYQTASITDDYKLGDLLKKNLSQLTLDVTKLNSSLMGEVLRKILLENYTAKPSNSNKSLVNIFNLLKNGYAKAASLPHNKQKEKGDMSFYFNEMTFTMPTEALPPGSFYLNSTLPANVTMNDDEQASSSLDGMEWRKRLLESNSKTLDNSTEFLLKIFDILKNSYAKTKSLPYFKDYQIKKGNASTNFNRKSLNQNDEQTEISSPRIIDDEKSRNRTTRNLIRILRNASWSEPIARFRESFENGTFSSNISEIFDALYPHLYPNATQDGTRQGEVSTNIFKKTFSKPNSEPSNVFKNTKTNQSKMNELAEDEIEELDNSTEISSTPSLRSTKAPSDKTNLEKETLRKIIFVFKRYIWRMLDKQKHLNKEQKVRIFQTVVRNLIIVLKRHIEELYDRK
ncbi:uncharacterized protein [Parasteatoda tepidariorum]|uniref:uncharacterized protein n=1 Tax=Parasteatoda tepidariorum TaxID=114398 RepID=UPI0039BD4DA4